MGVRLKGRRTALAVTGLGLVILLVSLAAFRNEFLAGWYLRDLDSEDPACRIAALERLAALRSRLAIPRLQKLVIDSPQEAEQEAAIRAILRAEAGGLGSLLRLGDPIPFRVMRTLSNLSSSDPAALAVLVDLHLRGSLSRYPGPIVRQGGEGAVVPHLLRALRDPDPAIRGRASGWLVHCPAALEDLLSAARDPDERVREGVLAALRAPRWHGGPAVQTLAAGLRDRSVSVRAASAWALGGFGGAAGAAIPDLIRAMENPSFDSGWDSAASSSVLNFHGVPPVRLPRILAVRALGSMDRREAPVLPALQKALGNGSPPIRVAVAGAILRLVSEHTLWPPAGTEALPVVVAAYRSLSLGRPPADPAPGGEDGPELDQLRLDLVEEIVRLAGEPGPSPPLATAVLLEALRDYAERVRAAAIRHLGNSPSRAETLLPALAETLEIPEAHAAPAAARALAMLGSQDPKATGILLEKLRSPRESTRAACALALRDVGGDPALVVPALTRLLRDPSPPVRAVAAETLGFYAHTAGSAIPDLTRLLEDRDRHAREAAASALEKVRKASE